MKAPFGWTVIRRPNLFKPKGCVYLVYKRDTPADAAHWSADLAQYTHATKARAVAAGKRGEFAYKQ